MDVLVGGLEDGRASDGVDDVDGRRELLVVDGRVGKKVWVEVCKSYEALSSVVS
jgi:hypothetical protein